MQTMFDESLESMEYQYPIMLLSGSLTIWYDIIEVIKNGI